MACGTTGVPPRISAEVISLPDLMYERRSSWNGMRYKIRERSSRIHLKTMLSIFGFGGDCKKGIIVGQLCRFRLTIPRRRRRSNRVWKKVLICNWCGRRLVSLAVRVVAKLLEEMMKYSVGPVKSNTSGENLLYSSTAEIDWNVSSCSRVGWKT